MFTKDTLATMDATEEEARYMLGVNELSGTRIEQRRQQEHLQCVQPDGVAQYAAGDAYGHIAQHHRNGGRERIFYVSPREHGGVFYSKEDVRQWPPLQFRQQTAVVGAH